MAKRGRPESADPLSERVDIRLQKTLFDAICREALRTDIPLAVLIRLTLKRRFLSVENRQVSSSA